MSGDTGLYTEEQLLRLGAVGFLSKPFRFGGIIQILEQNLR